VLVKKLFIPPPSLCHLPPLGGKEIGEKMNYRKFGAANNEIQNYTDIYKQKQGTKNITSLNP